MTVSISYSAHFTYYVSCQLRNNSSARISSLLLPPELTRLFNRALLTVSHFCLTHRLPPAFLIVWTLNNSAVFVFSVVFDNSVRKFVIKVFNAFLRCSVWCAKICCRQKAHVPFTPEVAWLHCTFAAVLSWLRFSSIFFKMIGTSQNRRRLGFLKLTEIDYDLETSIMAADR